jgi:hypothetical protein
MAEVVDEDDGDRSLRCERSRLGGSRCPSECVGERRGQREVSSDGTRQCSGTLRGLSVRALASLDVVGTSWPERCTRLLGQRLWASCSAERERRVEDMVSSAGSERRGGLLGEWYDHHGMVMSLMISTMIMSPGAWHCSLGARGSW